jgi:hypothetical protein
MDVCTNVTIQALLGEDRGQYCTELFGLGERVDDTTTLSPQEDNDDIESDDETIMKVSNCPVCRKTCYPPNKLAIDHIDRCQASIKAVASTVLEDYLRPSIWCWHPQRLMSSPLQPLRCWN